MSRPVGLPGHYDGQPEQFKPQKRGGPRPGAGTKPADPERTGLAVTQAALETRLAKFVTHYLEHGNQTQAAIFAGYSERTAHAIGTQLMRRPIVRDMIRRAQDQIGMVAGWDVVKLVKSAADNYHRAMAIRPVLDKYGNPTGMFEYNGAVANQSLALISDLIGAKAAKRVDVTSKGKALEGPRTIQVMKFGDIEVSFE